MKTISLKLAKKLKEAGFKVDSCFSYVPTGKCGEMVLSFSESDIRPYTLFTPAYTLDEILEFLPSFIRNPESINDFFDLLLSKNCTSNNHRSFSCYYLNEDGQTFKDIWFRNLNPAEAAGKLLLWCIENGYVKPNE